MRKELRLEEGTDHASGLFVRPEDYFAQRCLSHLPPQPQSMDQAADR